MTERRGYEAMYGRYLELWKSGQAQDQRPSIIGIGEEGWHRPENASPVLWNNLDKIGLLGRDVSGDVVQFYRLFHGILVDLRGIAMGTAGKTVAEAIHTIENDLAIWRDAKGIGQRLSTRL
jgi:hypothetical protein